MHLISLISSIDVLNDNFLYFRYALLTKETWPQWPGDPKKGCIHILKSSQVAQDEYQMGKSKVFVKAPESVSHVI